MSTYNKPWQESIEEEATEWHEAITPDGDLIRAGTHNKAELLKAQKRRITRGKNVIEPFTDWLITHYGINYKYARKQATLAWSIYEETQGNPVSVIHHSSSISYTSFISIRSSLTRFATWLGTRKNGSNSTREIGRRISNEILRLPGRGRQMAVLADTNPTSIPKYGPFSDSDDSKLYHAIEKTRDRYGTRWPWLWSILRIYRRITPNLYSIVHIKRSDATYALQRHLAGELAGIPLWSKRKTGAPNSGGTRIVPVSLIDTELRPLVYWPYEWSILADIIAPTISPQRRIGIAVSRIRARFKNLFEVSGVPWEGRKSLIQNKYTAMLRIYRETEDLLLLQQIFGMRAARIKRFPWIKEISNKIKEERS